MRSTTTELAGLRILVTRPEGQNVHLIQMIEAAGGQAIVFPTLAIGPSADPQALAAHIAGLEQASIAIFISPNAVNHGMPAILQHYPSLPATLQLACIGRGTAEALAGFGYHSQIGPQEHSNSEALLELPQLKQVKGKKIVIFRGNGGRDVLRQTLAQRGATVSYAECYQRGKPDIDAAPLQQRLCEHGVDIITMTSGEALRNLCAMLDVSSGRLLKQLPMVVISPRIAQIADELGFQRPPLITANAGDDAIIETLKAWSSSR